MTPLAGLKPKKPTLQSLASEVRIVTALADKRMERIAELQRSLEEKRREADDWNALSLKQGKRIQELEARITHHLGDLAQEIVKRRKAEDHAVALEKISHNWAEVARIAQANAAHAPRAAYLDVIRLFAQPRPERPEVKA